ncbi:hypothetical protein Pmar_PMAR002609 [Perkinsus marinus ATCC 50983]|uniref:Uncharacterized protein n=1 Tax=Perkinsus marinus (strain ATCC 50983 / TXsc) TaxID=423536 RepID=C5LNR4_PERM5|nr:hypothetical protein Pmar_PMAR002609 [Perkinsus marinus ATCC 50983]EER01615.1 hypothetical protein Pmar_PMAR002609 [Perkinsus marinus ATCC 50983]|eukprot:XP_002768897.1 hypothetical protein Pmar_PMAR002609 [Perkinsus marinus ATCC 50983]
MEISVTTFISTPDLAPTIVKVLASFKVYTIEVLRDIYEDSDARNAIGDKCAKELVGEVRADSGEAVSEDPPDTAKQSDATVGKSSAVSSVGTSSGSVTSGYDQLTYQIIKARVVGALKRVTKSGGNDKTAGSEDTIQVMNSKALSMFGVIPSRSSYITTAAS